MTVTVKLDPVLEEKLRRHAAAGACTTSDVIRAALQAYLAQPAESAAPSAFSLGNGLFGRHHGDPALAQDRKQLLADAWAAKHQRRGP